jgi:outer membrane receptor protein involved in Fe transport
MQPPDSTVRRRARHRLFRLPIGLLALLAFVEAAAGEANKRTYTLPADAAERTIKLFAEQSGRAALAGTTAVRNVRTNAVRGEFSAREALDQMLVSTGLVAKEDPQSGAFVISREEPSPDVARTAPAAARSVRPSAETQVAATAGETVVLSPFNVNADEDVGYQAANTTAGSRLNTSLKDTAAAISPFTKEFLDDIGAITLTDLMAFASNADPELDDSAGFNANAARRADSFNSPFRIRGQAGAVAIDLADTGVPVDLADIERVEVASGPNSVLFGNGATGGLVNLATKRASVRKSDRMLRTTVGSWASVRHEIDFNQVLRKDQLAVRLFGVASDRKGWRYWDYEDTRRLTGAVTLRPWASTTLSVSHGRGELARNLSIPWNAMDEITLWRAQGARVTDAAPDIPGAGTASISTVNRFTFMENDAAIYNLRNKLSSRGGLDTNDRLLTAAQMPFDYNFTGPGARYTSDFQNTLLRLEQKLGDALVVEAAFQRNRADNAR